MARLRAMRRGRRKGDMIKGVTHAELRDAIAHAGAANSNTVNLNGHVVPIANARKMLQGYYKMVNFWQGKSPAERGWYIKDHYLSGTTHKPWHNMTLARLVKILNRTKHNKFPRKFISRRGNADFINQWALFKKAPSDNKAKMFQALLRQMVIENRLYWNRKNRKIRPKYENNGEYDDLLAQFDGWDRMIRKRGRQAAAAAAAGPQPPPAAVAAALDDDDDDDHVFDGLSDNDELESDDDDSYIKMVHKKKK